VQLFQTQLKDWIRTLRSALDQTGHPVMSPYLTLFLLKALISHNFSIAKNHIFRYHPCPIIKKISEALFNAVSLHSPAPEWLPDDLPLVYFMLSQKTFQKYANPLAARKKYSMMITQGLKND